MKNNKKQTLLCLCVSFLLCNASTIAPMARRAIIDIGSMGTKIEVADVDTATHKIVQTVYKDSAVVAYKDDLAHHNNPQCFSEPIIQQGIALINQYITKALNLNPQPAQYQIIATEGFRSVPCSTELTKRFTKETGVPVTIISQNEEARLAFNGIIAKSNINQDNIVSWEIGGGSTQIATHNDKGTLVIFGAPIGGVTFKNLVITSVLHKMLPTTLTPNPLGHAGAEQAINLGKLFAAQVPAQNSRNGSHQQLA
jgi:exopolyphosphatase/pppGpp-phosphohydrolase